MYTCTKCDAKSNDELFICLNCDYYYLQGRRIYYLPDFCDFDNLDFLNFLPEKNLFTFLSEIRVNLYKYKNPLSEKIQNIYLGLNEIFMLKYLYLDVFIKYINKSKFFDYFEIIDNEKINDSHIYLFKKLNKFDNKFIIYILPILEKQVSKNNFISFVKNIIEHKNSLVKYIKDEYLEICLKEMNCVEYLPPHLIKKYEFYLLQKYTYDAIKYIEQNQENVLFAVSIQGQSLLFVKDEFKNDFVEFTAVANDPVAIEYVRKQTLELCLHGLKFDRNLFANIAFTKFEYRNRTQTDLTQHEYNIITQEAIRLNPLLIECVQDPIIDETYTESDDALFYTLLSTTAIKLLPRSLLFVKKDRIRNLENYNALVIEAIKINVKSIYFLPVENRSAELYNQLALFYPNVLTELQKIDNW